MRATSHRRGTHHRRLTTLRRTRHPSSFPVSTRLTSLISQVFTAFTTLSWPCNFLQMEAPLTEHTGVGLLTKILLTAPVAISIVVVGAMLWWVATSESPQEVNLQSAVSQLEDPTIPAPDAEIGSDTDQDNAEITTDQSASTGAAPVDTTEGDKAPDEPVNDPAGDNPTTDTSSITTESKNSTLTDIVGVWTVDTSIGDYDYEEATGSFAGFRVNEVVSYIDERTAVGRTGDVSGTITIADDTLTKADVTVMMHTLGSNIRFRDRAMHQALNTSEFPEATFELREPVPLPTRTSDDDVLTVQATGQLYIAGRRKEAEFELKARLVDDVIVVTGSSEVLFIDYDIKAPTAPVVVSVEDRGTIELQLLFTR